MIRETYFNQHPFLPNQLAIEIRPIQNELFNGCFLITLYKIF